MLLLSVSVPAWLRIPPPPPIPGGEVTVLKLTSLLFRIVTPAGPVPIVPLTIPPPPWPEVLPVTRLRLSVSVPPPMLAIPPAGPAVFPPVTITRFRVKLAVGLPPIKMMRKLLLLPAIVAPPPLIVIGVLITGRPLPPAVMLLALVSEYVQPAARLIVPPPAAFAAFTAATKPAAPPSAPEQGTRADVQARPTDVSPNIETAIDAARIPKTVATSRVDHRLCVICPLS